MDLLNASAFEFLNPREAIEAALMRSVMVVPSVEGAELLAKMLPTLAIPPSLVVVLDQGSTDMTDRICDKAGVELRQIGKAHSFTQCCNIALNVARERGAETLFIANNDIRFMTDVCRELLDELLYDDRVAICAPSQLIVDPKTSEHHLAYRARWDLQSLSFVHDFQTPDAPVRRLQADFCELTFAAIRVGVLAEIGGFDDAYEFYHEDADLGFRLGVAGYACVCLPGSQIQHFTGSTIRRSPEGRKRACMERSRNIFAGKWLGYGLRHADHKPSGRDSWSVVNIHLHRYLNRYGLHDDSRPELIFSHPGTKPFDYLYTLWETTRLPAGWDALLEAYRQVLVPSRWSMEAFAKAGAGRLAYVPLGVESDVFHPWGPAVAQRDERAVSYLWFASNQHRKGLDIMLAAWAILRSRISNARLILMGTGLVEAVGLNRADLQAFGHMLIHEDEESGISYREIRTPLSEQELAAVYRSVDVVVNTSRAEGFGLTILEAMACGTIAVFPGYSGCSEFAFEGALQFGGRPVPADYSDKGFGIVGEWWEPEPGEIADRMQDGAALARGAGRGKFDRAVSSLRSRLSWRATTFHLRAVLSENQAQKDLAAPPLPTAEQAMIVKYAKAREAEDRAKRRSRSYARMHGPASEAFLGFDAGYYERTYPDVVAAGYDPLDHYVRYGWVEQRRPAAGFDTADVLNLNPVARRIMLGHLPEDPLQDGLAEVGQPPAEKPTLLQRLRPRVAPSPRNPLLVGYVEAELGLGQSARGTALALARAGVRFNIFPHRRFVETRLVGRFMPHRYSIGHPHAVAIFEVAPDHFAGAIETVGENNLTSTYKILRPYWELGRLPEEWREDVEAAQEIWAPTRFIADVFQERGIPVTLVPPVLDLGAKASFGRRHFGLPDDTFLILFSFDYTSGHARKNPLALLDAFRDAFPSDTDVGLVLKSTGHPDLNPKIRSAIAVRAATDSRIRLLDGSISRDEMVSLIGCCDAYASLHRSEGFGLGLAEAMSLGKPVASTDYAGPRDFITVETGYPVAYRLRPVRDGEYPRFAGQSWAEPDPEAAIEALRALVRNPAERNQRASAGRDLVQRLFDAGRVGRRMRDRLRAVRSGRV